MGYTEEFLERKARRSRYTAETYRKGLGKFAECFNAANSDEVIQQIQGGRLDPYKCLDKFISYLTGQALSPNSIVTYETAASGLMRYADVNLDPRRLRDKVEMPSKVEISIDRIPTREEIRQMLMTADLKTRALIGILATSGFRIGEAARLRVANIDFETGKLTLLSPKTKSRKNRVSFVSMETVQFIREYLRDRGDEKDDWLFVSRDHPEIGHQDAHALYMNIFRVIKTLGLNSKLDPDSKRNQLHPHCLRKYFFSKLIGAGVDRGISEQFMGHKFGLDSAYLQLTDSQLREKWAQAEADFTFLSDIAIVHKVEGQLGELKSKNLELEMELTQLRLAVQMLQTAKKTDQ